MRAVVVHEFGPPSVLVAEDAPDPVLSAGEVMIDVDIANVTFVETQVRAGKPPNRSMLPRLPAILGNGVGGVVSAVGSANHSAYLGQRVISSLHGTGGYAARAVADAAGLIIVPCALRTEDAVALLSDGRTAIMLVRSTAIEPGETVLIDAAAGGVGSLLVQLVHSGGGRVVGLAGGERKLAVVRDLGADAVVDYLDPAWPARLRAEVDGVDVVFDGVGGAIGRAAFDLLRPGGRFCPFGMSSGAFAAVSEADAGSRHVSLVRGGRPKSEDLRALVHAALAESLAGRMRPLIGQVFPLERAADAHAAMEQRTTVGKTLLTLSRR
jgi:NADPH2:quinone reductase